MGVGKVELAVWLVIYSFLVAIGISSVSYILVWIALEATMAASIVYMLWQDARVGALFYYYVVQALGSLMMIAGAIGEMGVMLWVGFILKMGLFPLFVWMVSVVWGLGGLGSVLVVLWAQKLIPLVLLFEWGWVAEWSSEFLVMLVFWGVIGGSIGMLVGGSLKWLLVMSSMVHTSWLIMVVMDTVSSMVFYFGVYGFMLALVLWATGSGSEEMGAGSLVVISSIPPLLGFSVKFYSFSLVISGLEVVVVGGIVLVVGTIVGYLWGLIGNFMTCSIGVVGGERLGAMGVLLASLTMSVVV
uniref:NADH:ubiquinone reductase (H(+)-translocating) n=1 Tax=Centrorhynchus milvus TaxID=2594319 RepID=A0A515KZC2_9BILA|nr:NADH dehydrogenase subunit 2 [Centrorhynchus milvus]